MKTMEVKIGEWLVDPTKKELAAIKAAIEVLLENPTVFETMLVLFEKQGTDIVYAEMLRGLIHWDQVDTLTGSVAERFVSDARFIDEKVNKLNHIYAAYRGDVEL